MAGYRPRSFLCVFMDRGGVEFHKLAKKNEANIQPSWPKITKLSEQLLSRDKAGSPERAR